MEHRKSICFAQLKFRSLIEPEWKIGLFDAFKKVLKSFHVQNCDLELLNGIWHDMCHTRVPSMTRIGASPDPYLGDLQGQSGSWGAYTQVHFQWSHEEIYKTWSCTYWQSSQYIITLNFGLYFRWVDIRSECHCLGASDSLGIQGRPIILQRYAIKGSTFTQQFLFSHWTNY